MFLSLLIETNEYCVVNKLKEGYIYEFKVKYSKTDRD